MFIDKFDFHICPTYKDSIHAWLKLRKVICEDDYFQKSLFQATKIMEGILFSFIIVTIYLVYDVFFIVGSYSQLNEIQIIPLCVMVVQLLSVIFVLNFTVTLQQMETEQCQALLKKFKVLVDFKATQHPQQEEDYRAFSSAIDLGLDMIEAYPIVKLKLFGCVEINNTLRNRIVSSGTVAMATLVVKSITSKIQ